MNCIYFPHSLCFLKFLQTWHTINHSLQLYPDLNLFTLQVVFFPFCHAHLHLWRACLSVKITPLHWNPLRCAVTRWRHWASGRCSFSREVWAAPSIPGRPGANILRFPPSCPPLLHTGLEALHLLHDYWLNVDALLGGEGDTQACCAGKHLLFLGAIKPCSCWQRWRCWCIQFWNNAPSMHLYSHVFAVTVWKPFLAAYYNHMRAIYNCHRVPQWPHFHWCVKLCWCLYISPSFPHLFAFFLPLPPSFVFSFFHFTPRVPPPSCVLLKRQYMVTVDNSGALHFLRNQWWKPVSHD